MNKILFYNKFVICLHMFRALCARNMCRHITNLLLTRFCLLSWLITKIILRSTVSKTKIVNHVSNKTSGANNIDIRGRKSIADTIVYFGVNVQNSICSSCTKRATLTQVETELNSPDTFRSRPVNTNTARTAFKPQLCTVHNIFEHSE